MQSPLTSHLLALTCACPVPQFTPHSNRGQQRAEGQAWKSKHCGDLPPAAPEALEFPLLTALVPLLPLTLQTSTSFGCGWPWAFWWVSY